VVREAASLSPGKPSSSVPLRSVSSLSAPVSPYFDSSLSLQKGFQFECIVTLRTNESLREPLISEERKVLISRRSELVHWSQWIH